MPIAKIQFYGGVSCQLLMGVMGNVKRGGNLSSHLALFKELTATSPRNKEELQREWDTWNKDLREQRRR